MFFCIGLTILGQTGLLQEPATVDAFRAWVRSTAIPIGELEAGARLGDLKALKSLIGSARIVAFGEPFLFCRPRGSSAQRSRPQCPSDSFEMRRILSG
jgi:hypothetical protein